MEEKSHIYELMAKMLSGEANQLEIDELGTFFRDNSDDQYAFEMLSEWWQHSGSKSTEEDVFESFNRIKNRITPEDDNDEVVLYSHPSFWKKYGWATAAVFCALVGSIAFLLYSNHISGDQKEILATDQNSMSQVYTNYGSKSNIVLPDGTLVLLNSGSTLTYDNKKFGKENREVNLVGEAYFDVAKDANNPFIIHAGKINVKVLGTVFDIKSYPEDSVIQATLIKGAIEVAFLNRSKKKIRMKPNQTLTVLNTLLNDNIHVIDSRISKSPINDEKGYLIKPVTLMSADSVIVETSWVENKLAFQSEKFTPLAKQMERWYNVHINFTDNKVRQYKFTGVFMNESLEEALKALKLTAPFDYKIEGDDVYISSRK